MNWKLVVGILCVYGFFKEFRPLEPFLTPFLRSELKNFTDVQLYSQIYPVWTYSYLAALVPIFLLTDLLRYNIILILGALVYGSTWFILIFGWSVAHMQVMQFFYGIASATEVAYYAYAFAAIEPENYKKATSYVRCVVECGRFCSYTSGQTLISTRVLTYLDLNYLALAGSTLILIVALFLPCISWKRSLDRIGLAGDEAPRQITEEAIPLEPRGDKKETEESGNQSRLDQSDLQGKQVKTYWGFVKFYFKNLWNTFKKIYSTKFMWKWSLWSALAMCGMLQVTNYIQPLWDEVQQSQADVWNGIVEAINTFLAAIMAVTIQFVTVKWEIWGEFTMAIISMIDCAIIVIMSQLNQLAVIYVLYIIFRISYETMFTIAMYNIAKNLATESFGLVFGFNTFVALVLQTILTIAVADERGFALNIRNQFIIYGVYHGLISIAFLIIGIRTLVGHFRGRQSKPVAIEDTNVAEQLATS